MTFPIYRVAGVDVLCLHAEIEEAGPFDGNFTGITVRSDQVRIEIEHPSESDKETIKEVVEAHSGQDLKHAKSAKLKKINDKTDFLISQGFSFQGMTFSISLDARNIILGIYVGRDKPGFAYPVRYNSKSGESVLALEDPATVEEFYLTAVSTFRLLMDSGTELKDQVRSARTVAEVDAIIDAR